ncbi:MAG: glucokinase [Candidatus Competibacteraceae bacterium]|nr:glucokinase [Candidatus Competibacteraceae bacterium]
MSTGHPDRLIADIGGTNARFALTGADGAIVRQQTLPCADYPGLTEAVEYYLAGVGEGARPREAAMAIATPITGDRITMTNHVWSFSIEETRQRLGLGRLLMLNDFTALAMALPYLDPGDLTQVGGDESRRGAIALLGPGTGLGVSGLIPVGEGWVPLQGEGGHVTYGPATDRELEILRITRTHFEHVSAERLISGMGLINLYQAIASLEEKTLEQLTPAQISQRGLEDSDPLCTEAVATFCSMLGTVAGNLALTLGAVGGVYIGGGIVPRLGEYFARSPFRERFQAKGRFRSYLEPIPCFVIRAHNPALVGVSKAFDLPG